MRPLRFSITLFILLLTLAATARAQTISGIIMKAGSQEPVPFVNIGVPGKTVGTVADEQGRYRLSGAAPTDTVRISSIGFRPRRLTVQALLTQPNMQLTKDAVALREVKVKAKGYFRRTTRLGFDKVESGTTANLAPGDLGGELGTVIRLRHRPSKVLNVNFNITDNKAADLLFRVNLYQLRPDGTPSNDKLLARDVVVKPRTGANTVAVDLTADKLILDEDFFLALEWIGGGDARRVNDLLFSGGIGYANNDLYERKASQATWEKVSVGALMAGMQVKLAFWATVQD